MATRKRSKHTQRSHATRKGLAARLSRYPKWAWWLGGALGLLAYILIFYYFFVGPTSFRWRAIYGDPDYPMGYEIHGIDISHYQGVINWDRLRGAQIGGYPLRFVICKATEGVSKLDENFNDNFYNARENGFIRGAYHFWSNKSSAKAQAEFFLRKVHLEEGDLPPVLDVEHKPKDQSVADFQRDVLTWLHTVEDRYHAKPIIYTFYKFKQAYLSGPRFDDYPYWLAHYYVDRVQYPGPWKFWQHTDAGRLPGIRGDVDLNVYNGSYYDLKQLTIQADDGDDGADEDD